MSLREKGETSVVKYCIVDDTRTVIAEGFNHETVSEIVRLANLAHKMFEDLALQFTERETNENFAKPLNDP